MIDAVEALTPAEEAVLRDETPPEEPKAVETPAEPPAEPAKAPQEPPAVEEPPDDRVVPYGALKEERARRKELQQQLRDESEKRTREMATLTERLAQLQRIAQPEPARKETPAPTVQADPLAVLERLQQRDAEREQRDSASTRQQNFEDTVRAHEAVFKQTTPDYDAATEFLIKARLGHWQAVGVDPASAHAALRDEARAITMNALNAGKSPAEAAYKYAQALGYSNKPPPPAKPDPAESLKVVEAAQASTKSLNSAGGTPPAAKGSAEWLLSLTDREFEKLSDDDFRKAMGG